MAIERWSLVQVRFGSDRESSSITARCRPLSAARRRRRLDHGQLQSGNGLNRFRRVRSPLLRTARRRKRVHEDPSTRGPASDPRCRRLSFSSAVKPRSILPKPLDRSRRADSRKFAGFDRHRRGSGAVRSVSSQPRHSAAARCRRLYPQRRPGRGRANRLSGAGAAVVCARRSGDGSRLQRRTSGPIHSQRRPR